MAINSKPQLVRLGASYIDLRKLAAIEEIRGTLYLHVGSGKPIREYSSPEGLDWLLRRWKECAG